MKVLFYDHFFSQDIEAMCRAAEGRGHELRNLSYAVLGQEANKVFPYEVFCGLEAFTFPEYAQHRATWAQHAANIFDQIHSQFPFDLLISPSDTFFYLRDFIKRGQQRGVPTVILQKETTVTPSAMEHHSAEVKRLLPPICDLMLVCGERQREFWYRAGMPDAGLHITGQPRFDIYFTPPSLPQWVQLGIPVAEDAKTVLFLSYNLDTYKPADMSTYCSPGMIVGDPNGPWKQLHEETIESLAKLADDGYTILIKPHPQQDLTNFDRELQAKVGSRVGRSMHLLPSEHDTRYLILKSNVIVGFQTTALLEAMAAKKEVVYTHWTPVAIAAQAGLTEFYDESNGARCARSPEDLISLVKSARSSVDDPQVIKARNAFFERYIGRCEAGSSQRVWEMIESYMLRVRGSSFTTASI